MTKNSQQPKALKFTNVSFEEASRTRGKGSLSAREQASDVYINELILTKDQRDNLEQIYMSPSHGNGWVEYTYQLNNTVEQEAATALLRAHHLDERSLA